MSQQQPDNIGEKWFRSFLEFFGLIGGSVTANPFEKHQENRVAQTTKNIYDWAKAEGIEIHAIHDFTAWRNDIHVFYPTRKALTQYQEDGTSERLRHQYISVATTLGVPERVITQWEFHFNSYESIQNIGYQHYFN